MVKNGSEILIDALVEQGVDTIFGYPGGAVLNIYDALYKNSDRIQVLFLFSEAAGKATKFPVILEAKLWRNYSDSCLKHT